jgi:hypothetical protein
LADGGEAGALHGVREEPGASYSDESAWRAEAAGAFCERDGGPYDIIVVDGEVVDVICYPPADDGQTTVVDGDGDIAVPQNENNTTVTFDEATDGTPIEGDLVIDGNNVAVYGNGIDETVILGNVVLDGNNVRLRG